MVQNRGKRVIRGDKNKRKEEKIRVRGERHIQRWKVLTKKGEFEEKVGE